MTSPLAKVVIESVFKGELDQDLDELYRMLRKRELDIRRSQPVDTFAPGEKVRFRGDISPSYLRGFLVEIVSRESGRGNKWMVKPGHPNIVFPGKFASHPVIAAPPSILVKDPNANA